MDLGPAGEPIVENLRTPDQLWIEPMPDGRVVPEGDPADIVGARESVRLAFVAALQQLPPRQRAVLILCEVLRWKAAEVAELLETSVASVNSALQRARKAVDDKLPEESQQATLRALGDDKLREIVDGYMDAMSRGDVDAMVGMLADDASWSMPPLPGWFTGPDLRGFMEVGPLSGEWRWRHLPTRANGQLAVASYAWYEPDNAYRLFAIDTFTVNPDGRLGAITSFINRSTLSREDLFYQRYPEQPVDESNISVDAERFGVPELLTD
jgi:RNA polymerase sigma-70 factor (ECF subfamily)